MINPNSVLYIASQISDFVQFFTTPWGAATAFLVGTILGIIGIWVGVIALKSKKPSYLIRSFTLISSPAAKPDGLEIRYSGNVVEQLTISRVLFLNVGKEVINRDDIAPKNPLRIVLAPGVKAFTRCVIYAKHGDINGFNIEEYNNDVLINFDYLAKNEGGIIQMVHSGDEKDIKLVGTIKGINVLHEITELTSNSAYSRDLLKILVALSFILFSVFLIKDAISSIAVVTAITLTTLSDSALLRYSMGLMIGKFYLTEKDYFKHMNQEWKV